MMFRAFLAVLTWLALTGSCPVELGTELTYTPSGCAWSESTYCYTREAARAAAASQAALVAEVEQLRARVTTLQEENVALAAQLHEARQTGVAVELSAIQRCELELEKVLKSLEITSVILTDLKPPGCWLPTFTGASTGLAVGLGAGLWLSR